MDLDPEPRIDACDQCCGSGSDLDQKILAGSGYEINVSDPDPNPANLLRTLFVAIKSIKESHKRMNQGFSYYFGMTIEGSGSGSIPLTSISGSGFGRAKNMWIRIRNTGSGKLNFTSYIIWFISVQSILTEHQLKSLLPIFLWSKIENYS